MNWSNLPETSTNPYWYAVPYVAYCPICDRPLIALPERAYAFCPTHKYRLTDEQQYRHMFAIVDAINRINTLSMTYTEPLPFDLSPEAADIEATRGANT